MHYSETQEKVLNAIENTPENIFITGEAGSGKSFVIKEYLQKVNTKKFPILASTGAAAVLIGGRTFHSFMGLGILEGGVDKTVERALKDKRLLRRLNYIEGFVLDEVSMISGEVLRAAEQICSYARSNTLQAWGGLRVIFVGDFAQLPPVQKFSADRDWSFKDSAWRRTQLTSFRLERNYRVQNNHFLNVLSDVRSGKVTARVNEFLKSKVAPYDDFFLGTTLFSTRGKADIYNNKRLVNLDGENHSFETIYMGHSRMQKSMFKMSPLPETLNLKIGCLIMLRKNDVKQRWVNGSLATVRKIDPMFLTVELSNGRDVEIEKETFSLLDSEGEPVASVMNFPVTLAYATTIHKAQGLTLDALQVDLSHLWEPGHAYVALSRIRNAENLKIIGWKESSFRADRSVIEFYDQWPAPSEEEFNADI